MKKKSKIFVICFIVLCATVFAETTSIYNFSGKNKSVNTDSYAFGFDYQPTLVYGDKKNDDLSKTSEIVLLNYDKKAEARSLWMFHLINCMVGSSVGGLETTVIGCSFEISSFNSSLFYGFDIEVYTPKEDRDSLICFMGIRLGLYKFLPILNYPGVFTSVGVGFSAEECADDCAEDSVEEIRGFYLSAEIGGDIEVLPAIRLQLKYQLLYDQLTNFSDKYMLGFILGI